MNIHLLRIYSVPIRISSPEFHVQGTCSFHEWDSVRWHVVATCHPLYHSCYYTLVGVRSVYVPIYINTVKEYIIYEGKSLV